MLLKWSKWYIHLNVCILGKQRYSAKNLERGVSDSIKMKISKYTYDTTSSITAPGMQYPTISYYLYTEL